MPKRNRKGKHVEPEVYCEPTPAHAVHVLNMLADALGSRRESVAFMRAHPNCVIVVPSLAVVERLALEVQSADSLHKNPSASNAVRLSSLHGVERRILSRAYTQHHGKGITKRRNEQG